MDRKHIKQLVGSRRAWLPIAVNLDLDPWVAMKLLEVAQNRGWQLINLSKFSGQMPVGLKLRGALVDRLPDDSVVQELLRRGVPTVRLGRLPHPQDPIVPAILPDRAQGGRLAAEHFAERGFRHVAFIGRDPWRDSQTMFEAYAARATELGCAVYLRRLSRQKMMEGKPPEADWWEVQRDDFVQWVTSLPRPLGLLGFSVTTADRYCHWLAETGLRVPEDVAVLGDGNQPFVCESALVPLSGVQVDSERIVVTAVEMLEKLMAGERLASTTVMVPPLGIVTRQSTDVLAAADPHVVMALRYIWDHITDSPSVDEVADHVGVSRRKLERTFQRVLGRGVNQEFQRRRLEKARDLLLQTDLRIAEISDSLNFGSRNYFCRSFRAVFGVSSTTFRRRHRVSV